MEGCEKMNGRWSFVSSEGFDDYMKAIGVNFAIRKLAGLGKPDVVIEIKGDQFMYQSISTARTTEIKCTIGKEFEETMPDKSVTKSVMNWEGNKLVHKQEWDGRLSVTKRYVDDDGFFVLEFTCDGAKCTRKFKKQT